MQDATTYLGEERLLPSASWLSPPFGFRVWINREGEHDTACLTFGTPGAGLSMAIWTTPEALRIVAEECQKALASEHDEAQTREPSA